MTRSTPHGISDDDLCSSCRALEYHPGGMSYCAKNWPCTVESSSDYITECPSYDGPADVFEHPPAPSVWQANIQQAGW